MAQTSMNADDDDSESGSESAVGSRFSHFQCMCKDNLFLFIFY